jgi:hypothetical protein
MQKWVTNHAKVGYYKEMMLGTEFYWTHFTPNGYKICLNACIGNDGNNPSFLDDLISISSFLNCVLLEPFLVMIQIQQCTSKQDLIYKYQGYMPTRMHALHIKSCMLCMFGKPSTYRRHIILNCT